MEDDFILEDLKEGQRYCFGCNRVINELDRTCKYCGYEQYDDDEYERLLETIELCKRCKNKMQELSDLSDKLDGVLNNKHRENIQKPVKKKRETLLDEQILVAGMYPKDEKYKMSLLSRILNRKK